MKLNKEISTYTYDMDVPGEPGFMLDIVEYKDIFEVWIAHTGYGIKSFEYGLPKQQTKTIEDVVKIMKPLLLKCIGNYKAQYFTD